MSRFSDNKRLVSKSFLCLNPRQTLRLAILSPLTSQSCCELCFVDGFAGSGTVPVLIFGGLPLAFAVPVAVAAPADPVDPIDPADPLLVV